MSHEPRTSPSETRPPGGRPRAGPRARAHRIAPTLAGLALLAVAAAMVSGTCLTFSRGLWAQPFGGRVIDRVEVDALPDGERVEVRFFAPVQYRWHFPHRRNDLILVKLAPVSVGQGEPGVLRSQETVPLPPQERGLIESIRYDGGEPGGPFLIIRLVEPLFFRVDPGPGMRSIAVTLDAPVRSDTPEGGGGAHPGPREGPDAADHPEP